MKYKNTTFVNILIYSHYKPGKPFLKGAPFCQTPVGWIPSVVRNSFGPVSYPLRCFNSYPRLMAFYSIINKLITILVTRHWSVGLKST